MDGAEGVPMTDTLESEVFECVECGAVVVDCPKCMFGEDCGLKEQHHWNLCGVDTDPRGGFVLREKTDD